MSSGHSGVLARLSAVAPANRQTVLEAAARAVAETVGDGGAIWLGTADGDLDGWAAVHPGAVEQELLQSSLRHGFRPTTDGFAATSTPPEARRYLDRLGVKSLTAVPLRHETECLGFLGAVRTGSDLPYGARDTAVIEDIGVHVVMALSAARATERQRTSDERYRRVVEATTEGVWEVGADGRITFANDRVAQLVGKPREEMIGRPAEEFLDEAGRLAAARRLRDRGRGIGEQYDDRLVRVDGSTVGVRITAVPLHDHIGRPTGSLWIITDVTDRVRATELERQIEQMRRLDSLGQLAGGIAHDFNNLLVVMGGFAQVISSRLEPESELVPFTQQIMKAAAKGEALTRQLLTFGRGGPGRSEVVDVGDVLMSLEPLLRRTLGEQTELVVVCTEEGVPPVQVDPGKLEQVVINLATNARDAMPDGGRLTIECSSAPLQAFQLGTDESDTREMQCARIAVSDTGLGMDSETQRRAFEPFFTTKDRSKGTGLGLATVYGIIRAAGGHIGVYSEPGIGTTVKVFLPATDSEAKSAAPPPATPALPGPAHVLVVEDQDEVAQLIPLLLDSPGLSVTVITEPLHALSYARAGHQIDMLLTDVIMPEMTGPELVTALHEQRPDLPVLYMSGYTAGVLDQRGPLAEGADLIEKPFTRASLLAAVTRTLANASSVRGAQSSA